ncbi:MAG: helix-turn-helix transcriptional regulator [Proteobacteria bacterium]|nr:helix-turn-helix transcriptional regulator [Pseudomonadota bacterium]MCH8213991.1 helix-turn-helix transcriptional regulator [Pseudomonadota bacterium]
MLTHSDIWRAIDRLAREYGFSASGLARRSGLDPTTFNKSKRTMRDGRLRWPSTESISKILTATGAGLEEFVSYVGDGGGGGISRTIPLIGFAQAAMAGCFDDAGHPVGAAWDEIAFPALGDPHAYALEISGDGMEPVYRDGDTVIVSPWANIRRGDRVVIRTGSGAVTAGVLRRRSVRRIDVGSINPRHEDRTLPVDDVQWMARIVWATQ